MKYQLGEPVNETLTTDVDVVAAVAGLMIGNGAIAVEREDGALVLPIWVEGDVADVNAWFQAVYGVTPRDVQEQQPQALQAALRSMGIRSWPNCD